MDFKDAENQLDKADSFMTKLKSFLKKHWGILLLLLLSYFIYWALNQPDIVEPYDDTVITMGDSSAVDYNDSINNLNDSTYEAN